MHVIGNHIFDEIMNGRIETVYSDLYKEYFKKLYNYGRKFTKDIGSIEDSIQEVFLDLWNKKDSLSNIQSPNSYILSAFRYTLLKKVKQSNKITSGNEEEKEDLEFSIENIIISKEIDLELQKKLLNATRSLTSRQLEAIYLRFHEGLPYEKVAEILNISVKATYKIMARSLSCLKENVLLLLFLINISGNYTINH